MEWYWILCRPLYHLSRLTVCLNQETCHEPVLFSFPDEEKSVWIEFEDLPCTIVFLLAMQKDYSPITALSQPLLFSKQNIFFWKLDSQNLKYYFQYWFKLITFICLLRTLKPVWKYKIYWLCFCTIFLEFINLYDRRNSLIGEKFALTW